MFEKYKQFARKEQGKGNAFNRGYWGGYLEGVKTIERKIKRDRKKVQEREHLT